MPHNGKSTAIEEDLRQGCPTTTASAVEDEPEGLLFWLESTDANIQTAFVSSLPLPLPSDCNSLVRRGGSDPHFRSHLTLSCSFRKVDSGSSSTESPNAKGPAESKSDISWTLYINAATNVTGTVERFVSRFLLRIQLQSIRFLQPTRILVHNTHGGELCLGPSVWQAFVETLSPNHYRNHTNHSTDTKSSMSTINLELVNLNLSPLHCDILARADLRRIHLTLRLCFVQDTHRALLRAVASNGSTDASQVRGLRGLTLSDVIFGSSDYKIALWDALGSSTFLRHFQPCPVANPHDHDYYQAMLKALTQQNTALQTLNLSHHVMTDATWTQLCQYTLASHPTLESLDVRGCLVSPEIAFATLYENNNGSGVKTPLQKNGDSQSSDAMPTVPRTRVLLELVRTNPRIRHIRYSSDGAHADNDVPPSHLRSTLETALCHNRYRDAVSTFLDASRDGSKLSLLPNALAKMQTEPDCMAAASLSYTLLSQTIDILRL